MRRDTGRWLVLFVLCAASGGCTAMVYSPAKVTDPVPIYLAEYAVHSDVLLPRDGHYVDYSFGDWNYAALHHTLPNDAIGALAVSGDSVFERRLVAADPHTGEPQLYDNYELLIRLTADRDDVERRLAELDRRFQNDLHLHHVDGLIVEGERSKIYVKDTEHYSMAHNCNHLTAETLRALGYRVEGVVLTSHFHVAQ
jgi:Protein of unknown function (DUF2459)